MPGPKPPEIVISEAERSELERLVRAQTTGHTALMTGYIGMGGVFLLGMSRDPPFTDRQLAWIFCAVVIAYGLFRVWQLLRLRESARYLRQSIRQMGVQGLAV